MPTYTLPNAPFGTSDLSEHGLTRGLLRRLVSDGLVRRVIRGVYVDVGLPETIELRARAVSLVVADGHITVDRTAAWLYDVDVYSLGELEAGPAVETCVLPGHHPTERCGVDGRIRALSVGDVATVHGLRVTTPLRTALDLGCQLRRREALAALCGFAHGHAVQAAQLSAEISRFAKRRGVVQLRELLPLVDPRIESPREAWTLLAIHDAGLPLPEPQVWIDVDGVPTYRLDFAYRRRRVCVEYDGADAHDLTPEQRKEDRTRRKWLREHGWTVIVVKVGDFSGDRLDGWLNELRAALRPTYSTRRW